LREEVGKREDANRVVSFCALPRQIRCTLMTDQPAKVRLPGQLAVEVVNIPGSDLTVDTPHKHSLLK